MKTTSYVNDLRSKSTEELSQELVSAKKELFNLRFQNATNQLDNTSRIKEVRKNIARIQAVITEKIFRADGRDYAQGMVALGKACGVGRKVIERIIYQGKLQNATTYAEGRPLYDIEKTLAVLRAEGFFLDTREKHLQACSEAELKYMRGLFNVAMKYHELPFRKYKMTNVPRLDGTIRVDDTMTIEEAREKAASGDFSGDDNFNRKESEDMSWLTDGVEEELGNEDNDQ